MKIVSDKDENNPMDYCLSCSKYLGFKGFCSEKCHNKYYEFKEDEELAKLSTI